MAKPSGFSRGFGPGFGVGRYHYELTPWLWDTSPLPAWRMAASCVGSVDLRPLSAQALAGGAPQGVAFAASLQPTGGVQICRSLHFSQEAATSLMQDAWQGEMGYRPAGANVVDLLWDQLTTGADPSGESGPKPLMPGRNGLELWLPGHSLVKREAFRWGVHPHTNRVQAVLQRDFERLWEERNGHDHCRRVLDYACKKFGVEDWQEFVPTRLRPHVPGRLPHATIITDDFDRANNASLGSSPEGWSWAELGDSTLSINSNQVFQSNGDNDGVARAESDLSSADHYAQIVAVVGTPCPCVRFDAASLTYYLGAIRTDLAVRMLYKRVSSTYTQLALDTVANAANDVVKLDVAGSTLTLYRNGVSVLSITDSSISAGIRTGIANLAGFDDLRGDDFEASDGAAAPTGHPATRRLSLTNYNRPLEIGREGAKVI